VAGLITFCESSGYRALAATFGMIGKSEQLRVSRLSTLSMGRVELKLSRMICYLMSFVCIVVSLQNPSRGQFRDDQRLMDLLDELQAELNVDGVIVAARGSVTKA
jgi:hypothetical protein